MRIRTSKTSTCQDKPGEEHKVIKVNINGPPAKMGDKERKKKQKQFFLSRRTPAKEFEKKEPMRNVQ